MPRSWYDIHALPPGGDEKADMIRELYGRILADKKPYFMRYIYSKLMSDYNKYIKKTDQKSLMLFGMTARELCDVPEEKLTEEQKEFLRYYHERMPVSDGNCVLNKLCRKVEDFVSAEIKPRLGDCNFDYSFMKSGREYTRTQYYAILKLYKEYVDTVKKHMAQSAKSVRSNVNSHNQEGARQMLLRPFLSKCYSVCNDEQLLCDIIIDVCYQREGTKQFVWDICGRVITGNLFRQNGGMIEYPARDENGDIEYAGDRFSMVRKESTRWLTSL